MSINNGQLATQEVFNNSFLSKLSGGIVKGKVDLRENGKTEVNGLQDVVLGLLSDVAGLLNDVENYQGGFKVVTRADLVADDALTVQSEERLVLFKISGDTENIDLNVVPFGNNESFFSDGQVIRLYGTSDTNYVKLLHNNQDYGCLLNGASVVLTTGLFVELMYDSTLKRFVEMKRSDNA